MTLNKKNVLRFYTAFVVGTISAMVMFGWYVDSPALKAFGENNVSMKFVTALLFFCCALEIVIDNKRVNQFLNYSICVLTLCSFTAFLFNKQAPNFVPLFSTDAQQFTVVENLPSIMTLACFYVYGLGNIFAIRKLNFAIFWAAIVAIVGFVFSIPQLFFYFEGLSTGMAINTSILFIHISIYRINYNNIHQQDYLTKN